MEVNKWNRRVFFYTLPNGVVLKYTWVSNVVGYGPMCDVKYAANGHVVGHALYLQYKDLFNLVMRIVRTVCEGHGWLVHGVYCDADGMISVPLLKEALGLDKTKGD